MNLNCLIEIDNCVLNLYTHALLICVLRLGKISNFTSLFFLPTNFMKKMATIITEIVKLKLDKITLFLYNTNITLVKNRSCIFTCRMTMIATFMNNYFFLTISTNVLLFIIVCIFFIPCYIFICVVKKEGQFLF